MKRIFILLILCMSLLQGCAKIFYRSAAKAFEKDKQNQPYDVIIVPGFPYQGNEWDMVHKMRIHWAYYLFKKGYAKNIIFSGSAVATPYVESKVMAYYAEALGIPKQNIFTEEKAEHSTENVYYSYRLAKGLGFKKIALATDPFQSSYMGKFMRKFEIPVALLPTAIDTLKTLDLYEPKIDPKLAMKDGFVKLSSRENFFQRIKGTMGKYIIWHEEDLKKKKYRRRFKDRMISSGALSKEP
ncbi:YdcF family protein [Dyadobacter frigoris]|uniref:YdcF family protein n=1 Tax=Dyadobacter frigoris TaxID=2576211 RepID=UPI001E3A9F41|nr:YdcF family protein [Dyadobacter frigoris]